MNNLKAARKAANMTQADVAKIVGISQNGYSYWENGKAKIDHESLVKLSALFGVSIDYLMGASDVPAEKALRIPVLGSVPAGIPIEAIEDVVDWEEIPAAMTAGGKEYFALQVQGDSMWPDYLPGDIVIVRKQPCCGSGEDCVVYVNGFDATLKQVKHNDEQQTMSLIPRNPSYPPRTFTKEEIENLPVTIAGVVVELRRKVQRGK